MTDTVLVTGISGFIGGHVAVALLDAGYRVRGSLRDMARADKVRASLARASAAGDGDRLEFVALDLLHDRGWDDAASGCRYVQHVASPLLARLPDDPQQLIRPAVEGTRRAIAAALQAGVERIVLTSSAAAVVYGHPHDRREPFTAADWSAVAGPDVNAYSESKTRAELDAWSLMEAEGRRRNLVTVNPVVVLGPLLDDDTGVSGQLILRLLQGAMPLAPRINVGIVDVRDIAALQIEAMEAQEAGGQRLLASAGSLDIIGIADVLRRAFPGRAGKLPSLVAPDWLVRLIGLVSADVRANLGSLGVERRIDARAATRLLGRDFRPPAEAVIAMAQSLIERRLLGA